MDTPAAAFAPTISFINEAIIATIDTCNNKIRILFDIYSVCCSGRGGSVSWDRYGVLGVIGMCVCVWYVCVCVCVCVCVVCVCGYLTQKDSISKLYLMFFLAKRTRRALQQTQICHEQSKKLKPWTRMISVRKYVNHETFKILCHILNKQEGPRWWPLTYPLCF